MATRQRKGGLGDQGSGETLGSTLTLREFRTLEPDVRMTLIEQLIPVGLLFAAEEMEREVEELAGTRYGRKASESTVYRFGTHPGTVKLGGKRYPIRVPRVRTTRGEIQLKSYELLHRGSMMAPELLGRVMGGVSCRGYEGMQRCGGRGTSKSTVSRHFVAASTQELVAFQKRDLSPMDVVAVFFDGKYFGEHVMVMAVGVALDGSKSCLGFVESGTENAMAMTAFLEGLVGRGLDLSKGLLTVIDGSRGLRKAVRAAFGAHAVVQRCQWHKRENVASHMPKGQQQALRHRLQRAYDRPTHQEAQAALQALCRDLAQVNQSAHASLEEGLEETLTLHRLGVFAQLGKSFKTTNCIESIHSMVEQTCERVDSWRNSGQRQRWLAAALQRLEPRLNRVQGHTHLSQLRAAIMRDLKLVK